MLFGRGFAKFEDLSVVHVGDELLRFFRWTCWSPASVSSREGRIPCSGGSRTAESTFWLCLCDLCPAVGLWKRVCQGFCSPRCCSKFSWNSLIRWVRHKMFLRLVLVDLVDRCANWVRVQPVAILVLSVPSGTVRFCLSFVVVGVVLLSELVFSRERVEIIPFVETVEFFSLLRLFFSFVLSVGFLVFERESELRSLFRVGSLFFQLRASRYFSERDE